ncbi:acyl carrier protein [Labrys neptuniae]|uniref:acyl carrier protein n=1 Tax=Labrys neptuniae TaxID=376174 RepID=UPI00288D8B7C|nr:acyl carrier protein [Labrys neptuniae]MDT3379585.1 acyl carrier protein [Labrys neptuniae]
MISEAEVYSAMREIFSDVFMRDDIEISPSLSAKDVKEWDSFKNVEVILATETYFTVKLTSAEIDNLRTLSDLVRIAAQRGRLPAHPA